MYSGMIYCGMQAKSICTGADLGFSEGGAKPSSGSLCMHPPEAIGYLVFEVSKLQSTFDGFLKEANKMYVLLKQEVW